MDTDLDTDEPYEVIRPRGWLLAAGAAGSIGGGFFAASLILPSVAPYLAGAGVFLGVAIGALLMRRARDRELLDALAPDEEMAADRHWELSDIAEHYRKTSADREKAELASDAKSRFLTTVSHELRTPLSGIIGLTEVLRTTDLSPEQTSFAAAIKSSGTLMLGLVDDMLDFAKIEAGRFDLAPRPIAIEPMLEEIAELLFSRANAKNLDLATYVDPRLPAEMTVDPERLRQVMLNLAGNALKFTETGGVTISALPDPNGATQVRFSVDDTGPGIPAEIGSRIFDEFERGDTESPIPGSGLGLGIARRIVEQMGADIDLEDRPSGGSTFAFSLPIARAETPMTPSTDLGDRRVLLLMPPGPERDVVGRQLGDAGAETKVATTPSQAAGLAGAAAAAREPFDLALVDPRATGSIAESVALIRDAAGTRLPAAILVAPGHRGAPGAYQSDGLDAYLVRPVRRASLLRIAEGLLSGSGFGVDPSDTPAPPVQTRRNHAGLHVLLAEDDDVNALLLRSMLLRFGHQVRTETDGEAAIVAAAEEAFDVMLVDLSLPKKSGFEVAEAVLASPRTNGTRPKLIAVTADGRPESRDRALAAGFDRYLVKPLTPKALQDLLEVTGAAAA